MNIIWTFGTTIHQTSMMVIKLEDAFYDLAKLATQQKVTSW